MTLIIGIKCSDGVVLGSDGAATFGTLGNTTIRQPIRRKLKIRQQCLVIGTSGPVGLGQRYAHELQELWASKKLSGAQPEAAMVLISQAFRAHCLAEIEVARQVSSLVGHAAAQSALAHTVVALPLRKKPCLIQFDHQGCPELASEDLPFISIGSGQQIADPFLALLRRLLWPDRQPTLAEGTFAVTWTLHHAIETNAGGVADPKQVVWLKESAAKELAEDELEEHLQLVQEVEGRLTTFIGQGDSSEYAPDIPSP